jgi:hypothetical protein
MLTLWTAAHLGLSPTSRTIQSLEDWHIGLLYETAMNYTVEELRKCYFDRKKSVSNFDSDAILDAGYSPDEIAAIKGKIE